VTGKIARGLRGNTGGIPMNSYVAVRKSQTGTARKGSGYGQHFSESETFVRKGKTKGSREKGIDGRRSSA